MEQTNNKENIKLMVEKWGIFKHGMGYCLRRLLEGIRVQGISFKVLNMIMDAEVYPPCESSMYTFERVLGAIIECEKFRVEDSASESGRNWSMMYCIRDISNNKRYNIYIARNGSSRVKVSIAPLK